ncbi:hypothetical protein COR50_19060 [Chitinophaga caeni]|uniref:YaiO beta-barrel domain-containing protein n=2 Tax=Chitinophaga caeni TaxID=2029983 RepID=A0A291QYR9_9BACT|nr:hypothetical protein COR50_19060 [Chitinophaga caeni]
MIDKMKLFNCIHIPVLLLLPLGLLAQQKKVDVDYLFNKAIIQTNQYKNYGKALELANEAIEESPQYWDIYALRGRLFLSLADTSKAIQDWRLVLQHQPGNQVVLLYLYNLEMDRANYNNALDYANRALARDPKDKDWLLKKFSVYQKLESRVGMEKTLAQIQSYYRNDATIQQMQADLWMLNGMQQLSMQHWEQAGKSFESVLNVQPGNYLARWRALQVAMAQQKYKLAEEHADKLLASEPGDTMVVFRKAVLACLQGNHAAAADLVMPLMNQFPNIDRYRLFYKDELTSLAIEQQRGEKWDSAATTWSRILSGFPRDTTALEGLTKVYVQRGSDDSVIATCNRGLAISPSNLFFLKNKTVAYEHKGMYKDAAENASRVLEYNPGDKDWKRYTDALKWQSNRNMLSLFHLQTVYEKDRKPASISSIQYLRYFKWGSIAGRFNYGHRFDDGWQAELESYVKHGKQFYSFVNIGYSPDQPVFPTWRAAYSIFGNFNPGWELELGGRYTQIDTVRNFTAVASVAKTWGHYWVNVRGFGTFDAGNMYPAVVATNRYYFDESRSYVTLLGGYGVSPDDRGRNNILYNSLGFSSYNIGAGFQKNIHFNTTLGIIGNYIRQDIPNGYFNQFDIYFSFQQRF